MKKVTYSLTRADLTPHIPQKSYPKAGLSFNDLLSNQTPDCIRLPEVAIGSRLWLILTHATSTWIKQDACVTSLVRVKVLQTLNYCCFSDNNATQGRGFIANTDCLPWGRGSVLFTWQSSYSSYFATSMNWFDNVSLLQMKPLKIVSFVRKHKISLQYIYI